jgi:NADH:ubiquinone oxidoreductase subunit 3 (subunit A)
MNEAILSAPAALVIYVVLVGILYLAGRRLAGPSQASTLKTSTYSSGEAPPTSVAAQGYRSFFVVALFFAILHLGVLMLGTSDLSLITGLYLVGLMFALLALILG